MSAVRNTDRMLKIMAYADGELEGAERDEVEAWIAEDGASVRFANELAGLGDLVKVGFDHSKDSKAVASFDIADAVMAQVAKAQTTSSPSARDEEKKTTSASASKPSSSASAASAPVISLEAARARRNTRVGIVVAAALAVAASVFMVMKDKGAEQPMARTQPASTEVAPTTNPSPAMTVAVNNPSANAPNANGANGANGTVEVNVEQTPGSSVSVFYVPSETESLSTSVVVWVDDQGGK